MVSAVDFENEIIRIINKCAVISTEAFVKEDLSLVTDSDLLVEKELINYIKCNFPDIRIVSEENPSSHRESYILQNKFAIIDPIDGTENFHFTQSNYGSVVSVVYNDFVYHGIYIPSSKQIVSSLNIMNYKFLNSSMRLLSTSCLEYDQKKVVGSYQNYRIIGSSSYMFFLIISGRASSYDYCGNAKIWDYYTGISLLLLIPNLFNIELDGVRRSSVNLHGTQLKHKCPFRVSVRTDS